MARQGGYGLKRAICLLTPVIPVLFLGCAGGKPDIIERKCSICHATSLVYQKERPTAEWDRILHGMKIRGLKMTPAEESEIRRILADRYSKD